MKKNVFSLVAFLLIMLFAAAADGLMDALGPAGFMLVGSLTLAVGYFSVDAANMG